MKHHSAGSSDRVNKSKKLFLAFPVDDYFVLANEIFKSIAPKQSYYHIVIDNATKQARGTK